MGVLLIGTELVLVLARKHHPCVTKESVVSGFSLLAYFDPGSGSMLVQAIIGGGAGLLVFGRYLMSEMVLRFRGPKTR